MRIVTIRKCKRPAGVGSWRGYELGEDDYGTWVFTPEHSTYTGVHADGRTETCEVAQGTDLVGRDSVILLPVDGWYVGHWVHGIDYVIHVDIATPATRFEDTWSYDDLELDPYLTKDGEFGVEDGDEFDAACARGLIQPHERARALHEVEVLRRALTSHPAQLLQVGTARLDEGRKLGLPPLPRSPVPRFTATARSA
ncbi:DUF402 domain-containing protein [Flexivirga caeni]|nr:DUF402 domain-containing protein [Flexivirga caeni]